MKSLKDCLERSAKPMYMFGDIQQLIPNQTSKFYFLVFRN